MKAESKQSLYYRVIAFFLIVVMGLCIALPQLINGRKVHVQLTAEQLDFIDSLQKSYSALGQTAELEDYNSTNAVVRVTDRKGNTKRHLFDLNTETVVTSNFNGKLSNNPYTVHADEIDLNSNSYVYDENNQVTTIYRPHMKYDYEYKDSFVVGEYINGKPVFTITYNTDNKIDSKTYANDCVYGYNYTDGYLHSKTLNGTTIAEYDYDGDNLTRYRNIPTGDTYTYGYDGENRVVSMTSNNGYRVTYTYCEGELTAKDYYLNGKHVKCLMNADGITTDDFATNVKTDIAERMVEHTLAFNDLNIQTNYSYLVYEPTDDELTEENCDEYYDNITLNTCVTEVNDGIFSFNYYYDESDNVTSYSYADNAYEYYYDDQNQLIAYTYNGELHNYSYDSYGNIQNKDGIVLTYGNGENQDRLTSYDNTAFVYDEIGNPTLYKNKILKWQGNLLTEYDGVTYKYDQSGVRVEQNTNGNVHKYYTEGSKVIYETIDSDVLTFFYEGSNVIGFKFNDETYFYLKNAHNDVVGIVDDKKNLVTQYAYDPWGAIISVTGEKADSVGKINPYRYRSYRYDEETGLYYLNTRYYDPETCRFINADDIVNLTYSMLSDDLSKNLYTYCGNNPVNMYDPDGKMAVWALGLLKTVYADVPLLNDSWISTPTLIMNGMGIYTAFHETAQLVAAKRLAEMGMLTQLEYKTSAGEADILAYKGINYLYEVKPFNDKKDVISEAYNQLKKYIDATGFVPGPQFEGMSIDFLPRVEMLVTSPIDGVVIYKFFNKYNQRKWFKTIEVKREVEESRVKKAISIGYWVGVATAGTIILATLAEDVITSGAGIANDVHSLGVAAKIFRGALSFGMLFI